MPFNTAFIFRINRIYFTSKKIIYYRNMTIRVLNVAEKNDAAKNLSNVLSKGNMNRREGFSKFNKIYEFQCEIEGHTCHMKMTSVSGHLLGLEFDSQYRSWNSCAPERLFDLPVNKVCVQDMNDIKRTLEREIRNADWLIIWTDCDREGENIGFEVIQVCQNIKSSVRILRANFSEITAVSAHRALRHLIQPNSLISQAVDVRQELDLRIGASFTRFQTLRLTRKFPSLTNQLISYGSCQFPTMGFVVERYKAIENFVPEKFWKIKVLHKVGDRMNIEFLWKRVRLFNEEIVQSFLDICKEASFAIVDDIKFKPKSKWRPLPLDTVELEKNASRKLRMSAKKTMQIAEKLYSSGYISYPRTETNIFPKELRLEPLVEMQSSSLLWGDFATNIIQNGGPNPREGKKSDQAHPPIHPIKANPTNLSDDESKLYEFIVRHFLAGVSKDAVGQETTVHIDLNGEKFVAHGLTILERNYLEVYPYDRWSDKEIPNYEEMRRFQPSSVELVDGATQPPNLLTEADLISLMDKYGIGTDATHADHIETIKARNYVGVQNGDKLVPGQLGIALCDGYDAMGFQMSKPFLRANLEADLKRICDGSMPAELVLRQQISKYREVFIEACRQVTKLDESCAQYLQEDPQDNNETLRPDRTLGRAQCRCGQSSVELVVNKEGPNRGRKFWVCAKPRDDSSHCDFFQWADENGSSGGDSPVVNINGTSSEIKCNCGRTAAYRTVHKEGANKGRTFYSCATPFSNAADTRCNFFQWALSPMESQPISREPIHSASNAADSGFSQFRSFSTQFNSSSVPSSSSSAASDIELICNCGNKAISKIVRKDGINHGREFYCCATPYQQENRCQFFKWSDEVLKMDRQQNLNPSQRTGGNRGTVRNSGRFIANEQNNINGRTSCTGQRAVGRRRRKCGVCHQEGHLRTTCPLNFLNRNNLT